MFIVEIIYNLTLLIAISIVAVFIDSRWSRTTLLGSVLLGLMFGAAALIGMMQPFSYAPGIFFDGRTVILSICALFFGPVSAIIATLIALLYRLSLGGSGVFTGITTIVSSAIVGLSFYYYLKKHNLKATTWTFLGMGLIVHLIMIALLILLPTQQRMETLQTIGLTIIIVFPIATIFIGHILKFQDDKILLSKRIKANEEKYRLLVENQSDLLVKVDPDGSFIFVNNNYCKVFGKNEDELIGKKILPLVHKDDRESTEEAMKKLFVPPYSCYLEQRAMTQNGWRWFGWSDKAVVNSIGEVESIIGVGRDITERVEAENHVKLNRKRLEIAEKMAKLGSWEFDTVNQNNWWSKQMYEFFRFNSEDGIPSINDYLEHIHPEDLDFVAHVLQTMMEGNEPPLKNFRTNPKYGTIKHLKPTYQLVKDNKGKILSINGTVLDITDTVNAENQLLESREELSITLMSIGDGVIATDTSGKITRMNPVAEKLTGLTINKAAGMHLEEVFRIFDSETNQKVECPIYKVLKTGQTVDLSNHTVLLSHNGQNYHIADSAAPIVDKDGIIKGVILVFSNVSSKYKVQNELNKERNLLRSVIDALPFSLYIKDLRGRKLLINKTEEVYTGKTIDEIIGKTDHELYSKEYAEKFSIDDSRVLKNGERIIDRIESVPIANEGERWISTTKLPWKDEQGNTIGLIGFGIDITERILAQQKIRKLSEGIEQSPNAVIITNEKGHIEYVNPRFKEMTGYNADRVMGKLPRILKPKKGNEKLLKNIWGEISNNRKWKGDFLSKNNSGEEFWESISISPITNDKQEITNYLFIIEDITERKQMIEDLTEAKKRAEESDQLKSAFLANMSHEIRTPMNGILGFAELLQEQDVQEDTRKKYLEVIDRSGRRMLNIINDIVDISKIEAGQISIFKQEFHLNELINEQFNFFFKETKEKDLNFTCKTALEYPDDLIFTDKSRLSQVLSNLIKNAIKFTHQGEIEFGYIQEKNMLQFYVKDSGIGIDKKIANSIFERFRRGDNKLSRNYEGAGLGLSISKALVEMMGGSIGIESKHGKGSTFYFTIPYKQKK